MKKIKLNERGFAHFLVPLMVMVLVGITGSYLLVRSHANQLNHKRRTQAGTACPSNQPGFSYAFWEPYDNWSVAKTTQDLQAEKNVGINGLVIDWAVDQEAKAAWYPDTLGYSYFENTIPTVIQAAQQTHTKLWLGLIVAPDLFAKNSTNWSFLQAEVPKFEAVADDLYNQYGDVIQGWDIPTEPGQGDVATYDLSYQYGAWLGQIDDYLHTHDGNKPVTIAVEMPSAANDGKTPTQFVQELEPMMAVAHMDIWNLEDGFGMTGWTADQEAQGFSLAVNYAKQHNATVWADIYTPSNATPAQFEPYLKALAGSGATNLSQWTFEQYMDPDVTTGNTHSASDYNQYLNYCSS